MSHYTLQSGEEQSTVTFKCEGCGERFPAKKMYGRGTVIDLRNGIAVGDRGVFLATVCSRDCSHRVSRRTLDDCYRFHDLELLVRVQIRILGFHWEKVQRKVA